MKIHPGEGGGAPPPCCMRRPHENDFQKRQKSLKIRSCSRDASTSHLRPGARPPCCLRRPHESNAQTRPKIPKIVQNTPLDHISAKWLPNHRSAKSAILRRFRASRASHRDQRAISRRMVQFQLMFHGRSAPLLSTNGNLRYGGIV